MRLQGSISCMLTICSPTVSVLSTLRMSSLKKSFKRKGFFRASQKAAAAIPRKSRSYHFAYRRSRARYNKRPRQTLSLCRNSFCPVLVQGEGAHLQLTAAVNLFNSERAADVIIIGRGGGSIEDLWEFNDEGLARAVYNSEIPVISAVGHETDFTICDFVADMRAPTPSAAAELAVPDANELQYALSALKNRMFLNVSSGIADRRSRLEYLTSKGALKSPDEMLSNRSQRLDTAFQNAVII